MRTDCRNCGNEVVAPDPPREVTISRSFDMNECAMYATLALCAAIFFVTLGVTTMFERMSKHRAVERAIEGAKGNPNIQLRVKIDENVEVTTEKLSEKK